MNPCKLSMMVILCISYNKVGIVFSGVRYCSYCFVECDECQCNSMLQLLDIVCKILLHVAKFELAVLHSTGSLVLL